jgi:23S rRNA pseudouridine2605 synthase
VELEDGIVKPRRVDARRLGRDRWEFEVTIAEGRKREVRRLCSALGLKVERLVRTRFGPVELGSLPTGSTRALTPKERLALAAMVGGALPQPRDRAPSLRRRGRGARGEGRG